jgi:hypothetical protein
LNSVGISAELKGILAIGAAVTHEFLASRSLALGMTGSGRVGEALTVCAWTTEQTMQARNERCWFEGAKNDISGGVM